MASEDDVLEAEHLLAEPKYSGDSIDNILGCDMFNAQKCFMIEDFSSHVKHDQQKISAGTLDYCLTQEQEKTRLKFFDGVLQGTDDGVLQGTNSFLGTCEDFLFHAETSEKVHNLDYGPCDESILGSFGLAGHSPTFIGEDCSAEISDLSPGSAPQLESTWNFGDLENGSNFLEYGTTSNKNDGEMTLSSSNQSLGKPSSTKLLSGEDQYVKNRRLALCPDVVNMSEHSGNGLLVKEKRLRKPPRRYIEESLVHHSRQRKCGSSYRSSRDRLLHARLQKPHCHKGFSVTESHCQEEPIQVPFGLPVENRGPKKKSSLLGYEHRNQNDRRHLYVNPNPKTLCATSRDERSGGEGGVRNDMETVRSRRKHHMLWTLSEVMRLLEGVSQYGVGRWTEIKRLLFSSSAHRTSVDLKDKWRNLLKASCVKLQTKRQVEQGKKHASHQVPQAVLRRVRELAHVHPYPRDRKAKTSSWSAPAASHAVLSSGSNMVVPFSAAVRV